MNDVITLSQLITRLARVTDTDTNTRAALCARFLLP